MVLSANERIIRIRLKAKGRRRRRRRRSQPVEDLYAPLPTQNLRHPGKPMPYSGFEFDSPPPSSLGIAQRSRDYAPAFYYFGGRTTAEPPSGSNSFSIPVNDVQLPGSDTETDVDAKTSSAFAFERDGVNYWVPRDVQMRFPSRAKDDGFDEPFVASLLEQQSSEDENAMVVSPLQKPKSVSKTTPVKPAAVAIPPIKDPVKEKEKLERKRERQWKRLWSTLVKKDIPRCVMDQVC